MTAEVHRIPEVGERCVVVACRGGREGRKAFSRSTGYGQDGRVLASSGATRVALR